MIITPYRHEMKERGDTWKQMKIRVAMRRKIFEIRWNAVVEKQRSCCSISCKIASFYYN